MTVAGTPLPAWVRDKVPAPPPEPRSIGLEDFGTSATVPSRWAVSAVLALAYSYRLLFMEGSPGAKYRWLRRAVNLAWIARRFSG